MQNVKSPISEVRRIPVQPRVYVEAGNNEEERQDADDDPLRCQIQKLLPDTPSSGSGLPPVECSHWWVN